MTLNSTEAMVLIDAARNNGVLFMEEFMYRTHPQTDKVRELVDKEFKTSPLTIEASFGFLADVPKEHRLVNPDLGGGSIMDIGCYPMSMSRMVVGIQEGKLFSNPISIKAKGELSERGIDLNASAELIFENLRVPKKNILPGKSGLGAALMCLDSARYGISWGAIGAAMDCYDTALKYSLERVQFGKPIASKQLQQKKLAEMLTEITKAQLLSWKLGKLKNEDKASSAQISMAKRNNVEMAVKIAREARQMLGGMGITGEFSIMRHMMNLESVITYEGTHDIHLLILGMDITGLNAF